MRTRILAEPATWLTTGAVARALDVTPNGVRWLVATGALRCERAHGGQRLYLLRDVRRLAEQRLTRRLEGPARPRMLWAGVGPRQPSLFGRAPLRLVKRSA